MTESQTDKEKVDKIYGTVLFPEGVGEMLLNGHRFLVIRGQLLYKIEEGYVITMIREEENYTVDHYLQLPESAPFQLINAKLIYMPSPYEIHQAVVFNLSLEIGNYVKKHQLGVVRFAPLDVHFDKENVVQPDLLFVSVRRSSIIQKFIMGAPDFVVEILSKGTAKADKELKMGVYGKYNVLEYWLIHPSECWVEVYVNEDKRMQLKQRVEKKGVIESVAIEGFTLEIADIFPKNNL